MSAIDTFEAFGRIRNVLPDFAPRVQQGFIKDGGPDWWWLNTRNQSEPLWPELATAILEAEALALCKQRNWTVTYPGQPNDGVICHVQLDGAETADGETLLTALASESGLAALIQRA
jgi:hypothetical protein